MEPVTIVLIVLAVMELVLLGLFINGRSNNKKLIDVNNAFHERFIEQEEAIEMAQRRSDILKEKQNTIMTLLQEDESVSKSLLTRIVLEITK